LEGWKLIPTSEDLICRLFARTHSFRYQIDWLKALTVEALYLIATSGNIGERIEALGAFVNEEVFHRNVLIDHLAAVLEQHCRNLTFTPHSSTLPLPIEDLNCLIKCREGND
jgi:hypothetical protein